MSSTPTPVTQQYTTTIFPTQWWFGLSVFSTVGGTSSWVDPSQGIITPYYENNFKATRCPSLNAAAFTYSFNGASLSPPSTVTPLGGSAVPVAGGYGYNKAVGSNLTRMAICVATSNTYLLCDAALVASPTKAVSPAVPLSESDAILPPFVASFGPPVNTTNQATQPTTHFRHGGQEANVVFLDGHVESEVRGRVPQPGDMVRGGQRGGRAVRRQLSRRDATTGVFSLHGNGTVSDLAPEASADGVER